MLEQMLLVSLTLRPSARGVFPESFQVLSSEAFHVEAETNPWEQLPDTGFAMAEHTQRESCIQWHRVSHCCSVIFPRCLMRPARAIILEPVA